MITTNHALSPISFVISGNLDPSPSQLSGYAAFHPQDSGQRRTKVGQRLLFSYESQWEGGGGCDAFQGWKTPQRTEQQ